MDQPSGHSSSRRRNAGSWEPSCHERDTTTLSPSQEIIASEFPSPECQNKSVTRSRFSAEGIPTGWEHTPQTRVVGGHPGTRTVGGHPPPSADTQGWERRSAAASHMIPRKRSRCLFHLQDTGTGMATGAVTGGGSEPRSAVQGLPMVTRWELSATHGPPQASWSGGHEVCRAPSGTGRRRLRP